MCIRYVYNSMQKKFIVCTSCCYIHNQDFYGARDSNVSSTHKITEDERNTGMATVSFECY
jgi:hypothetical protein